MTPMPFPEPSRTVHRIVALAVALGSLVGLQAQVVINATGAPPTTQNAMLELTSTTTGLLIPRMNNAQRLNIPSPPDGLMVYQTDTTGDRPPGLWYYDANTPAPGWRHVAWGPQIWKLRGNEGTTINNFLGTLDNRPVVFRIGNYERGRLAETGQLQFHSNYPPPPTGANSTQTELVYVQGAMKLNGGSVQEEGVDPGANLAGTIRFSPASPANDQRGRFEGYVYNPNITDGSATGWKQLDNNFYERKLQETTKQDLSACSSPTSTTNPLAAPRPWPIAGEGQTTINLSSHENPYYGLWEDQRVQYLFTFEQMAATGICPGETIEAIAFNVPSVTDRPGRIHFLRFRLKNTNNTAITGYDNAGLTLFSVPDPGPYIARGQPGYHTDGYTVVNGWNVHTGAAPFTWNGNGLLIDASFDNQEWNAPSIRYPNAVQGYGTSYPSLIRMYCDACGGTGLNTCTYNAAPPPGFNFPPTTPTDGLPDPGGSLSMGWGYVGGWNLQGGVSTVACDGDPAQWSGSGSYTITTRLPRVAFLAKYSSTIGMVYDVGSYMYAHEGFLVGDATWAASGAYPNYTFRGPGTLVAERSVWSDNSLLSDYVFDLYYDGDIRPEDGKAAANYQRVPLAQLPEHLEQHRSLPNLDGRDAWNRTGGFSVDHLTNQLWVAVEDQALYIQELNERMEALRKFLVERKLQEVE